LVIWSIKELWHTHSSTSHFAYTRMILRSAEFNGSGNRLLKRFHYTSFSASAAGSWDQQLVRSLLMKIRSVDGLRTLTDLHTTAPVCARKSFLFHGRKEQVYTLEKALFAPHGHKSRKVNIMQSSGGFGKSAFCDHFAEHLQKTTSITPVAISYNTVFGDICHPDNATFSIFGRPFPSYFLVTDWVTRKLPMWEQDLRREKVAYEAGLDCKPTPPEELVQEMLNKSP
jgi:hypothetical protein